MIAATTIAAEMDARVSSRPLVWGGAASVWVSVSAASDFGASAIAFPLNFSVPAEPARAFLAAGL